MDPTSLCLKNKSSNLAAAPDTSKPLLKNIITSPKSLHSHKPQATVRRAGGACTSIGQSKIDNSVNARIN